MITRNRYVISSPEESSTDESEGEDPIASNLEERMSNSDEINVAPPVSHGRSPSLRFVCTIRVASLNLQGNLKDKIGELEDYLKQGRYDVVALQEVRSVSSLSVNGFKYFCSTNKDGYGGVGFLVALHIAPLVTVVPSGHLNQLSIKINGTAGHADMTICSVYMPQESAPVAEREAAWSALKSKAVATATR